MYGGWTSHHYSVDLYNELHPSSIEPSYLAANARATMDSLKAADPHAVWVMQAWCFRDDVAHWPPSAVKGFLSGTTQEEHVGVTWEKTPREIAHTPAHPRPRGRAHALLEPQRELPRQALGVEHCTSRHMGNLTRAQLHNYGQNNNLFGALEDYSAGLACARREGGNLVGIGLTPEGLDQNEIVYERALDAAWDDAPADLGAWLPGWVSRRYQLSSATVSPAHTGWKELAGSAYKSNDPRVQGVYRSIFDMVPAASGMLDKGTHFFATIIPYDTAAVVLALDCLLAAAMETPALAHAPAFSYDVVDVARQVLLNAGVGFYKALIASWEKGDKAGVAEHSARIVELLRDVDTLLGTDKNHLLAPWIAGARSWATSAADADKLELDARNQILLWGTGAATPWCLDRYAAKHWHGVVGTAYARSWELFGEHRECRGGG